MRKYITLFFSVLIFLYSCKSNKAPDGVIDHDKMVRLLTEVHIVDGRLYGVLQSQDSINKYSTGKYDLLFKRFNTDSTHFIKSFKYYATQPTELQVMYDTIMIRLKKKTDSLNKVQLKKTDSTNKSRSKNALPQ
ncbi:DUF4296 domain-containing protein [Mucilaginibacter sp.]|uniref:DUF4296 domain-containing protein n=1 Tax=Mucilaginibacter sp. TaxID=1882438 RepID=UPI003D139F1C